MFASCLIVSLNSKVDHVSPHVRSYRGSRTASETVLHPCDAYIREFHESRGNIYKVPQSRATKLRSNLKLAEELLNKHKKVDLSLNQYPAHTAVQTILENGIIVSFVFDDRSGDITRVYIDDSISSYIGDRRFTAAHLRGDKVIAGFASKRMMAIYNSYRDKAKRSYLNEKLGVSRECDLRHKSPSYISLNCTDSFLLVSFLKSVSAFRLSHDDMDALLPEWREVERGPQRSASISFSERPGSQGDSESAMEDPQSPRTPRTARLNSSMYSDRPSSASIARPSSPSFYRPRSATGTGVSVNGERPNSPKKQIEPKLALEECGQLEKSGFSIVWARFHPRIPSLCIVVFKETKSPSYNQISAFHHNTHTDRFGRYLYTTPFKHN